jgi:hypothetical protein
MHHAARLLSLALSVLALLGVVYLLGAYLVVPAIWSHYERQPGLARLTLCTVTKQGIPGDPMNVGLIGSRAQVVTAMTQAGWHAADPITVRTSLDIGVDVVLKRAYADAPVSSLFFDGRRQDLAFERAVTRSPAERHHVRFWRVLEQGIEGREVWIGAASFDRGVGFSHDTGQITHHIAPDLDAERDFLMASLADAGVLSDTYVVDGVGPTLFGRNGGGDPYYTDGKLTIGVIEANLRKDNEAARSPSKVDAKPAKDTVWAGLVAAGRKLGLIP